MSFCYLLEVGLHTIVLYWYCVTAYYCDTCDKLVWFHCGQNGRIAQKERYRCNYISWVGWTLDWM